MAEDRVVEFSEGVSVTAPTTTQPIDSGYLIATEQGSTPSTPSTGKQALYPKTDGSWYQLDDTGTEVALGGAGGGALNFDTKGTAEAMTTADFSTGNNATFDGGGTIAGTLSISTTAADLIRGSKVIKYVGDATAGNNTNDYVARDPIDIPQGFRGRWLGLIFQYRTASYTSGNICARVKDTTNATILTSDSDTLDAYADATNNTAAEYRLSFYCPADCAQIEWGFQVLTGESSMQLVLDDVTITPDPFVIADFDNIEDWTAYTPTTQGFGTPSSVNVRYQRVGDTLFVQGSMVTGTATASEAQIGLPTGLTISSSQVADTQNVGSLFRDAASDSAFTILATAGDAYVNMGKFNRSASSTVPTEVNGNEIGNSERFIFEFQVQIEEWTSKSQHIVTPTRMAQPARVKTHDTTAIADTTLTFLGFDTTDFDDDGLFTNVGSANNATYTSTTYYTASMDSKVRVNACALYDDADLDADDFIRINICVNGAEVRGVIHEPEGTITSLNNSIQISDIISVSKDDKISIALYFNAGGSVSLAGSTTRSWFTVEQVDTVPVLGAFPLSSWAAYTPTTAGLGTVSSVSARYRIMNDTIEVMGELTTGTVAASEAQIGLPTGYTIASWVGASGWVAGQILRDATVGTINFAIATGGDTFVNISRHDKDSNTDKVTAENGDTLFASSQRIVFKFSVPYT